MKPLHFITVAFLLISTVSLSQSASISGTVLDVNYPLPGASVVLLDTSQGTTTDFDGNFYLNNINPGSYTVAVSYLGYVTLEKKIVLSTSENKALGALLLEPLSQELSEVVVTSARRMSEAKALNIQKKSLQIMNVIAADGIGKLPDRNAAEAVQRVPGVSIERDQGEGRFVAVRGLPSEWNATTINGNRIPTAEEETTNRATAFDFFPTEMIGYVAVSKALTPDQEADAIGGSVNFITKTAPAALQVDATIGTGYNQKADKAAYNGAFTIGNKTKSGKIGYLINASHWNRNWATDNFEARRKADEGVFRLELRDYTGQRKTTGFNAAMEFTPSNTSKFYIKTIYGSLTDHETHYKHRIRFDKYKGIKDPTNTTGRVELQNIRNTLVTQLIGAELGGKQKFSNATLDWNLATYRNAFSYGNIPNALDKSYYVVKFKQDGVGFHSKYLEDRGNGPRAYWNTDGGFLNANNPKNLFGFFSDPNFTTDPAAMKFADLELYKVSVLERDNIVASVDYEHELTTDLSLKVGAKFRDKDRRATFLDLFYAWDAANGATPTLADFSKYLIDQPGKNDYLKEQNTNIASSFGKVLSEQGMLAFYNQHFNGLSLLESDSALPSNGGSLGRNFNVDETHSAAYAMGTWQINEKWTAITGLRLSHTSTKVSGHRLEDKVVKKDVQHKNYLALLPSLHLKYSPNQKVNYRLAVTRSFARPDFGFISPGGSYLSAEQQANVGNPKLNPTYALNLDLLGEYYFDNIGILSGGVFYKHITDPIVKMVYQGDFAGKKDVEITAPKNGGTGTLYGVEFSFNKRFDFLPGFLDGFGVQTNYTFTQSKVRLLNSTKNYRMPRQADHLINAQLYYEKYGFDCRIAYNFKDEYVTSFGGTDAKNDIYYGDYTSLDFNTSYKISKHFTVFAELNNLLNKPLQYYYGDKSRPKQVEYYGIRGQFGVKWSL